MNSKQSLLKLVSLLLCGLVIAGTMTTSFADSVQQESNTVEQSPAAPAWQLMEDVLGGNVISLDENNGLLYMGTENGQLFSQDESGHRKIIPVTHNDKAVLGFHDLHFDGNTVYLATDSGLFRSSDNFQTFERLNALPSVAVYASGELITLISHTAVSLSDDGGKTWTSAMEPADTSSKRILSKGSSVAFVGLPHIWYSKDEGRNWNLAPTFEYEVTPEYALAVANDHFFFMARENAGDQRPVIISSEDGEQWNVAADLTYVLDFPHVDRDAKFLAVDDQGTIYVGVQDEVGYREHIGSVYALASGAGAKDWKEIYSSSNTLSQLEMIDGQLTLAEANTGRVLTYDHDNNTWHSLAGVTSGNVNDIRYNDGVAYFPVSKAVSDNAPNEVSCNSDAGYQQLYVFDQNGVMRTHAPANYSYVDAVGANRTILGLTCEGRVLVSQDFGQNFKPLAEGLPGGVEDAAAVAYFNGVIYAARSAGIFRWDDQKAIWNQVLDAKEKLQAQEFLGVGQRYYLAVSKQGVLSSDDGESWSFQNQGLANGTDIRSLAYDSQNKAMYGAYEGLHKWESDQQKWNNVGRELAVMTDNSLIDDVAVYQGQVFVAIDKYGVYVGLFDNLGWKRRNEGLPTLRISKVAAVEHGVMVSTKFAGMFNISLP